jgi:hypothetical protein
MRWIVTIGLLVCAIPAHATIAFVAASATACAQTTAANTHTCTLTSSTISGNTVIVAVAVKTPRTLTSATSSATAQWFVRAKSYANGANDAILFAVCQNCAALTAVTVNLSGTSIFEMGVVEYSGVSSLGLIANTSTTGNTTTPTQSITLQDSNNYVIGFTASLGNDGIPTTGMGTLRVANRSGTTSSHAALGIIENTTSSGSVTVSDTITSSQWSATAIELRTANPADPYLVDAWDTSNDAGGTAAANAQDIVFYLPQPTLSGNGIVCAVTYAVGATPTITDSTGGSNTWQTAATATGANNSTRIIYALGVVSGTSWIKMHNGGTAFLSNQYDYRPMCKEMYNLSTLDVTATAVTQAGPNPSAALGLPNHNGEIIFEAVGTDTDPTTSGVNAQGLQFSPSIVEHTGFSLISTNTVFGECFQDYLQATAAAITPHCDVENTVNANVVVAAFQTNSSGTPAPATGLHIDHQTTFVMFKANEASRQIQIPADGNMLALNNTTSNGGTITVTDSWQNAYSQDTEQSNQVTLTYAPNATVDSKQMVNALLGAGTTAGYDFVVMDIRGAKTSSPLCAASTSGSGSQTGTYNVGDTVSNVPGSYTPCAANNLMIWAQENGCGPTERLSGPSGAITDNVFFTGMTDTGTTYDYAEGHGHYFTVSTSSVNFNEVMGSDNVTCGGTNFYAWAVWEISPAPAAAAVSMPPVIF